MPRTAGSSQYEIRVEREELLRYLAVLSKSITSKDKVARISFDDGWLMIAVGEADFAIAAEGKWSKPVSIDASWIQKMNRLLPAGNPLVLRVEKKHFYINTFGVPCHEVAKKKAPAPSNGGTITGNPSQHRAGCETARTFSRHCPGCNRAC